MRADGGLTKILTPPLALLALMEVPAGRSKGLLRTALIAALLRHGWSISFTDDEVAESVNESDGVLLVLGSSPCHDHLDCWSPVGDVGWHVCLEGPCGSEDAGGTHQR